jgi:hypothetical protein
MNHAPAVHVMNDAAAVAEHCEHSPIVTHNIGFKLGNAVGMGYARQVTDDQWSDTDTLVLIRNCRRYFCMRRRVGANIPADTDEALMAVLLNRGGKAHVSLEIEFAETNKAIAGEGPLQAEKPEIAAACPQSGEVLKQSFLVIGTNRPDLYYAAVAEDFIRFVMAGIDSLTHLRHWPAS